MLVVKPTYAIDDKLFQQVLPSNVATVYVSQSPTFYIYIISIKFYVTNPLAIFFHWLSL